MVNTHKHAVTGPPEFRWPHLWVRWMTRIFRVACNQRLNLTDWDRPIAVSQLTHPFPIVVMVVNTGITVVVRPTNQSNAQVVMELNGVNGQIFGHVQQILIRLI